MLLNTDQNQIEHKQFSEIVDAFSPGDLLVINNTKVFPARLLGRKQTGGKVEVLLLEYPEVIDPNNPPSRWQEAKTLALLKSSKRPKPGSTIIFGKDLKVRIEKLRDDGKAEVVVLYSLNCKKSLDALLESHGQMPLPPYIARPEGTTTDDLQRYQTTYARYTGSVAAPTAGLHFSTQLINRIEEKGVEIVNITLHVGYGTFSPVRTSDIRDHVIHKEHIDISAKTAEKINQAKENNCRIWAVGTTTVRSLEFAADENGQVRALTGQCGLYIYPGYQFKIVDNMITNFHLPQSSLLFLVSALAGREKILSAYKEAIQKKYRFFSYGDAMAIITKGL